MMRGVARVAVLVALVFCTASALHQTAANQVVVGHVRVTALSASLVRIEPKGPMGFEDNTTFAVVGRSSFSGVHISKVSGNDTFAVLNTSTYTVTVDLSSVPPPPPPPPGPTGCDGLANKDINSGRRVASCRNMSKPCTTGGSQTDCCHSCGKDPTCNAWVYDPQGENCWLMEDAYGYHDANDRVIGGAVEPPPPPPPLTGIKASVADAAGNVLWSVDELNNVNQNVSWPSPTSAPAYGIRDFPRFYVPPWGPSPAPSSVDPALKATNGYDYRNNVNGDTYVFLLGKDLDGWHHGRREFIKLTGPTPLLPDWSFGTWFTYWHQYTEAEAKGEIERWDSDKLPLDVWALDMNWRNSPHGHQSNPPYQEGENHFYTYPNTELFPDFADPGTGWFDYIKSKGLRTYFNDHPFPTNNGTAMQTSPEEIAFRWAGLSRWMERGLTYWWFDANWGFSIPPPNVHYGGSGDGEGWYGMDNRVWGSHVYYESNANFNKLNPDRKHTSPPQRPIALTKYADDNMQPGLVQHQHPAQHRYPVWWTGDGVDLEASVESMVDSGVYDFKPYVHSDCGGDYRPKEGGDLLRWAAHCVFGTILRFHGNAHQPWSYTQHVEDTIREYLNMRYKLIPSLIAAGHTATVTAFPIVARCDLFWPEHAPSSSSNHQYLHLNDTLVAPIWDSDAKHGSGENVTTRQVWVPPGQWQDAWTGDVVTGPETLYVTQPFERIPLWHRRGGLVVTTSSPGLRVDDQDWSELTLEAFPNTAGDVITRRAVYAQNEDSVRTDVTMRTEAATGRVHIAIGEADDKAPRAWVVRLHLLAGQMVSHAAVHDAVIAGNKAAVAPANVLHIAPTPRHQAASFYPFGGKGAAPAPSAGTVAEIHLESAAHARTLTVTVA